MIAKDNFDAPALAGQTIKGVGVIHSDNLELAGDFERFLAVTPNEDLTMFDMCGAGLVQIPANEFVLLHGMN